MIQAEGEHKASNALKVAADTIGGSSAAMQLRYLQAMNQIASEKQSTILFPLPMDFMLNFGQRKVKS